MAPGIIKLFLIINCSLWFTNICNARELKEARFETSVGTFIIEGKVAKEAGRGMLVSYPEYYISVQEGNNKIDFYADGKYHPRMLRGREKTWSDEEELVGIFINFITGAYKSATLSLDDFCKSYHSAYGKGTDIMNQMQRSANATEINLQEDCKELYGEYQSNLNKIKILIGDTPDFLSKLKMLYNESLIIRKKMGIFLGSFLQS